MKLNGKLTLGENVADNGGVRLAWMALMEMLKTKNLGTADGFTPRAALLRRLGADVVREPQRRDRAAARADQPAFARQVPDERGGVEHAGVREGVRLSGERQDGAAAGLSRVW